MSETIQYNSLPSTFCFGEGGPCGKNKKCNSQILSSVDNIWHIVCIFGKYNIHAYALYREYILYILYIRYYEIANPCRILSLVTQFAGPACRVFVHVMPFKIILHVVRFLLTEKLPVAMHGGHDLAYVMG